ncbi:patatin-like phospholipase domain-containing protein 4 isoform X2 [Tiliqua scincoides]|uniref:patatin-like phospholipase domain-containing protein 4 isoform X2 n=1 Tax=Tiliqua scincoides TaxID=71010 RepID=UPI003461C396
MWATKSISRISRQWIHLQQTELNRPLFLKIQQFGSDADSCCILRADRVLSTYSVSQVRDTWQRMDVSTEREAGNMPYGKEFMDPWARRQHEMEAKMKHLNLSFAACGFLGIYHLGAASALCKHGKKLLKVVKAFAGASSGSLIATVLLTVPENIEECTKMTYTFAEETRKLYFGALTPGFDVMTKLRGLIDSVLPPNAHEIAENRLFVSVTSAKNGKNHLLSNFASREDLVKALLASSFIPLYAGINAMEYKGELSITNLVRLHQALFPPSQEKMKSLYQDGFDDAVHFLLKENWFE